MDARIEKLSLYAYLCTDIEQVLCYVSYRTQ